MLTQGPGAYFCAREQGPDLVLGPKSVFEFYGYLKKKVCSLQPVLEHRARTLTVNAAIDVN